MTLLTVGVLVMTLGWAGATWELWALRGVSDKGWGTLGVLGLGTALMAAALVQDGQPTLGVCVTIPGAMAAWMVGVKLLDRVRVRWHRPPPAREAMLPAEPGSHGLALNQTTLEARVAALGNAVGTGVDPETARAERMARLFG